MYNFITKAGQQINVPMVSEDEVARATRQSSTDLKETNGTSNSDFEFIRINHNTWFEFEKLWSEDAVCWSPEYLHDRFAEYSVRIDQASGRFPDFIRRGIEGKTYVMKDIKLADMDIIRVATIIDGENKEVCKIVVASFLRNDWVMLTQA